MIDLLENLLTGQVQNLHVKGQQQIQMNDIVINIKKGHNIKRRLVLHHSDHILRHLAIKVNVINCAHLKGVSAKCTKSDMNALFARQFT